MYLSSSKRARRLIVFTINQTFCQNSKETTPLATIIMILYPNTRGLSNVANVREKVIIGHRARNAGSELDGISLWRIRKLYFVSESSLLSEDGMAAGYVYINALLYSGTLSFANTRTWYADLKLCYH